VGAKTTINFPPRQHDKYAHNLPVPMNKTLMQRSRKLIYFVLVPCDGSVPTRNTLHWVLL